MGGQKAIEQLYRSLGKKVPVLVVSTQNNEASAARHFSLIRLFSNNFLRYGNTNNLHWLRKLVQQHRITHLIIEHPYMGWLGLYLKKKANIPLIVHAHNIESIRFKSIGKPWWRLLWYYERYILQAADFVLLMTEADRDYAVHHYKLKLPKTLVALYGTEVEQAPSLADRRQAKETVCRTWNIDANKPLLLFNGSFHYQPNATALSVLIENILPELNKLSFAYQLIVCGKNIPQHWKDTKPAHVLFLDFVDDIFLYNLAADVFVNPVTEGGGIKTKLVEALAAGANAVSAQSGAAGIDPDWCHGKLCIAEDGDWTAFAQYIISLAGNKTNMPAVFYQHFYIDNITGNILQQLAQLSHKTL